MSNSGYRDPIVEDLMERIRNLKELLQSEDANALAEGMISQSSGSRPQSQSPSNSPPPPPANRGSSDQQRPVSPPTRDSPVPRKNSQEASDRLIEETWHLLSQVTYVRIVIDRLLWQQTPKCLADELGKSKSNRTKSLLLLDYCFPMFNSEDGSVSSRDLGKRIIIPAKEVLPRVAHFNHRRVVLLRISQPILQLWSQSCFTIKICSGRKPNAPIGKCSIPLCKLLVLPFSFEADVALESMSENSKSNGKLKVCIQLGSRFQSFTERVEPMRNPTTQISEFAFIDPMKLVAHAPAARSAATASRNQSFIPISNDNQEEHEHDAEPIRRSGTSTNQRPMELRTPDRRQLTNHQDPPIRRSPIIDHPRSVDRSALVPRDDPVPRLPIGDRRLNETYTRGPPLDQETPSPRRHFTQQSATSTNWRSPIEHRDSENFDNEPPWMKTLLANRRAEFGTPGRSNPSREPIVSNISVYGSQQRQRTSLSDNNRSVGQTILEESANPNRADQTQEATSVQPPPTESRLPAADPNPLIDRQNQKPPSGSSMGKKPRPAKSSSNATGGRRTTVAEKLLLNQCSTQSSADKDVRQEQAESIIIPRTIFESPSRGFWLRFSIHRARNLSMVKDRDGKTFIKPRCFWTFLNETSTCYTAISEASCEPVWECSNKIFVEAQRKTLVLKLWHRGVEGRDRVLGFVAVQFPLYQPFDRVWYDIIDLHRASTGQVQVSFAHSIAETDQQMVDENRAATISSDPPLNIRNEAEQYRQPDDRRPPQTEQPDARSIDDRELTETGVNTTLPMQSDDNTADHNRRSSCVSPFLSLTTRSFLSQKLKENLAELSALTAHLKQTCEMVDNKTTRRQ